MKAADGNLECDLHRGRQLTAHRADDKTCPACGNVTTGDITLYSCVVCGAVYDLDGNLIPPIEEPFAPDPV